MHHDTRWREALIEAFGLAVFMVSACTFGALLEYPGSPLRRAIEDATSRRAMMGAAMGATAIALIYSPWGMRSGAHFNPSVTLAFWRLGRMRGRDAVLYALMQPLGGAAAVAVMAMVLGPALADPAVHFVVTRPGSAGIPWALAAEAAISFALMWVVLTVAATPRIARWAGVYAGVCVAAWILVEAPVSGMSMNPARTFASAVVARDWTAFWIYVVAPPAGMLAAAELHLAAQRLRGEPMRVCARLVHGSDMPCPECAALAASR